MTYSVQHKILNLGAVALLAAALATPAFAGECTVRQVDGHDVTICAAKSTAGKRVTATFEGAKITMATTESTVCREPELKATSAILWMPAHGHGSTPTTLTQQTDGCTLVSDIDFSMKGTWQIKLRFDGGDRAVVEFPVK